VILTEAQSRLLRHVSYRRVPEGVAWVRMMMAGFTIQSLRRLVMCRLVRYTANSENIVSTTKGEVQIILEDERIERLVRRARKRGNP
jgi:hypothetical protein